MIMTDYQSEGNINNMIINPLKQKIMINFKGSINLMQLIGAEIRSMEIAGAVRNVVVIPVDWNNIAITIDKDMQKPNAAYMNLRAWETNNKFRQTCIEHNADKEGYVPPTHQLQNSYSPVFQEAAQKTVEARLRRDDKYMAENPSDDEIKTRARNEVSNKSRVGTLTPLSRKQPQTYTGQAEAVVAGNWQPSTAEQSGTVDDLPF